LIPVLIEYDGQRFQFGVESSLDPALAEVLEDGFGVSLAVWYWDHSYGYEVRHEMCPVTEVDATGRIWVQISLFDRSSELVDNVVPLGDQAYLSKEEFEAAWRKELQRLVDAYTKLLAEGPKLDEDPELLVKDTDEAWI
jgi:hypothetical protein